MAYCLHDALKNKQVSIHSFIHLATIVSLCLYESLVLSVGGAKSADCPSTLLRLKAELMYHSFTWQEQNKTIS